MDLLARQMAERRERILAAARDIVGREGFDGLTMRALARASRVTVPTIYNLVGGKEAVLFAAIEEQTARFVAGLRATEKATPAARLVSVVDSCVRELLRLPSYYASLLQLLLTSSAAEPARAEVGRGLREPLRGALDALAARGDLEPWVDRRALLERLVAHLSLTSLQWAQGGLSREAFRALAPYEACLLMLGVTKGRSRAELERTARRSQTRIPERHRGPRPERARARR